MYCVILPCMFLQNVRFTQIHTYIHALVHTDTDEVSDDGNTITYIHIHQHTWTKKDASEACGEDPIL